MCPVKIYAPLLPLSLCLMVGIAIGNWLSDWTWALAMLVPVLLVTCLLGKFPKGQTAAIVVCVLLLGMALGARKRQQLDVVWPTERVVVGVVVMSEPVVKDKTVVMDVLTTQGHYWLKCHIVRDEDSERIRIGHGLQVTAYINKVHEWRNGHFDYNRFMQSRGFVGEMFVGSHGWQWQAVSLQGLSVLERLRLRFLSWRHELLERYRLWGVSDEAYGVVAAMTLGDKSRLDSSLREVFSRVGVSHVLALSGLHLMIIYAVLTLFIGWRRFRMLSQVLLVLAIWAFALLTGLSPSVTRSAFMISVYALLSLGYRDKMSLNTLAFTAIVMLVANPYALYDVGFQLSLMSVLAILLFTPLFDRLIPLHVQLEHRWLRALWGMTTVSLSAQIGTAPLVAYYFGRLPTYFLLGNYLMIPLTTLVLYLALACVALGWWPLAVGWVATALSWLVEKMSRLLQNIAQWPMSSIDDIRLSMLQVLLLYVVIGCGYVLLSLRCQATGRNG